jgi:Domain of unknown function (DUF4350)
VRDRLVTTLGAFGALAIVYGLFLQRPSAAPVTRPISVEAGRNGYLALASWLKGQGVSTVSWRRRLDAFADDPTIAATGNILITTMPYVTPLRSTEYEGLRRWIDAGNTCLILAALDDTPEWSSGSAGLYFLRDLTWLTGLTFTPYRDGREAGGEGPRRDAQGSAEAADRPAVRSPLPSALGALPVAAETAVDLEPTTSHPLFLRVDSLHGFSDRVSELWQARDMNQGRLVLRLATETSKGLDAFWQLPSPSQRGQVLVSASATWLTNRNIAMDDAREFIANLIAHDLGTGGSVIFDDMHQGLSVLYDASALVRDPRLKYTLAFLLAAWLVYLLGANNRLAPPLPHAQVPRQADFLAAAGGFMARRLDRGEAGLELLEEWFAEVRRRRGVEGSAPPWAEIEATPALGQAIYRELRESHDRLVDGRTVNLVRLHNVLRAAREAIG